MPEPAATTAPRMRSRDRVKDRQEWHASTMPPRHCQRGMTATVGPRNTSPGFVGDDKLQPGMASVSRTTTPHRAEYLITVGMMAGALVRGHMRKVTVTFVGPTRVGVSYRVSSGAERQALIPPEAVGVGRGKGSRRDAALAASFRTMVVPPPKAVARFMACIPDGAPTDECWIWPGPKTKKPWGQAGYGLFSWYEEGKAVTLHAHRLAYMILVGSIPAGLTLDHLCRRPPCFNPACTEPVTPDENRRRRWVEARAERARGYLRLSPVLSLYGGGLNSETQPPAD